MLNKISVILRYLNLYGLRFVRRLLKEIQFDEECKLEIDYRLVVVSDRYEINIFNPYSGDRLFISIRLTKFDGKKYIIRENFDKHSGVTTYSSFAIVLDDNLVDKLEKFSSTL